MRSTMPLVTGLAAVACAAGSPERTDQASTAQCGYWRIEVRNGAPDRVATVHYREMVSPGGKDGLTPETVAKLEPHQTTVIHLASDNRPRVYMTWPTSGKRITEVLRNQWEHIEVSCAER
jgi:hypothetical protein